MDRNNSNNSTSLSRDLTGNDSGGFVPIRDVGDLVAERDNAFINETTQNLQNGSVQPTPPVTTEQTMTEPINESQSVANSFVVDAHAQNAVTIESVAASSVGSNTDSVEPFAVPPAAFANPIESESTSYDSQQPNIEIIDKISNPAADTTSAIGTQSLESNTKTIEVAASINQVADDQEISNADTTPPVLRELTKSDSSETLVAVDKNDDNYSENELLIDDDFDNDLKNKSAAGSDESAVVATSFAIANQAVSTSTPNVAVGTPKKSRFLFIFLLIVFLLVAGATIAVLFFKDHLPPEVIDLVNLF